MVYTNCAEGVILPNKLKQILNMDFQQWLFEVVHLLSIEYKKDATEIYCNIDLYDAKMQFLDDIKPIDFKFNC